MTYQIASIPDTLNLDGELRAMLCLLLFMLLLLGIAWITSRYLNGHVDPPGPFHVILKEELVAGTLVYDVPLPTLAEDDVASRLLEVIVNDGEPQLIELAKDAALTTIKVPQDANVVLRLFNVDDAGNRSAPSEQAFVAKDTIPPDAPGPFGEIKLVAEE